MNTVIIVILVIFVVLILAFLGRCMYRVYGYCNPQFFEGVKIPGYVKSDHQKFDLESSEYKKYMENEFKTLGEFDKFAMYNDIIYTLVAGSLIGCLTVKKNIAWDDDIDLVVRESDWHKIKKLWDEGKDVDCPDRRFYGREIFMMGQSFILLMNKKNNGWFKLLKSFQGLPDIGGIDIGYAWTKDGMVYESMNRNKMAPGITSEYQKHHMSRYDYGPITVMSVNEELADAYISTVYNKKWKNTVEHPDYFNSNIWKCMVKF